MTPARTQPWQIAADLETAAKALMEAGRKINEVYPRARAEMDAITGFHQFEQVETYVATGLQSLSDRYQAIADAEPDERRADELRTGFREEDFA